MPRSILNVLGHVVRFVAAAFVAFAAANIGDLLVLLLFFADKRFRSWQIIAGQYLGVSAVIGLCLAGAAAVSYLPKVFIRSLGTVPIAVAVHQVWTKSREQGPKSVRTVSGWGGMLTIAGIAFADCSDDLAVFTPLYARSNLTEKLNMTIVFILMIGVWCGLASFLTNHQTLGEQIRKQGERIAPLALVGLGLFIIFW